MPPSLKTPITSPVYLFHNLGSNEVFTRFSTRPRRFHFQKLTNSSTIRNRLLFSAISGDGNAHGLSDSYDCPANHEDSVENNKSGRESITLKEILKKLKQYGISGILSYGLLNTAYYLTTFLLVWFFVAPVPGKMGYLASVERFLKVMAMVWAGSQVTKLIRAGGALALAPFVDSGLSWFTVKFKYESREKAFMTIVGLCFGVALILFFVVTLLWA